MKLTEKEDSLRERVCVFGGPKSGKTELVGNLASEFNLHYFDLENGYKTLRKLPREWQERIQLYTIPDSKVYPIAIETCLKIVPGNPVSFCVEHAKVSCPKCTVAKAPFEKVELNALGERDIVVWDSGTQLALSAMSNVMKEKEELAKPEWEDFMKQGFLMDKFLSQCQIAKYNLVFITHEIEAELEDGRKRIVPVAGTTNFSRNTAKYFDHVVYVEVKNKDHKFGSATTYGMSILTGSRTDIKIEDLKVPSLLPFFRHEIAKPKEQETPGATALANVKQRLLQGGIK